MPLPFHGDRAATFEQQRHNAAAHVVPFVAARRPVEGARVLDVGCGEGGVLKAFLDAGARSGTGVDLSPSRVAYAERALAAEVAAGRAAFVARDIYEAETEANFTGRFDLIVLKDAIEHIPDQGRVLRQLRRFLARGGMVFFGFPPWRMPYGGHQQVARSRGGKLPWLHLLPRPLYVRVLRAFGESEQTITELLEVVDTRLSIGRFERLLREAGYRTVARRLYLVNPIYEHKFGLKPRPQLPILRSLPGLRDFATTTAYYLVQPAAA